MASRILVVEDDKHIMEVVCEYLKDAGFTVTGQDNGKSALEEISQSKDISLFILDIMLPELSGLQLLEIIRMNEHYKNTPVIMLTALEDEATQLKSFNSLANDYVTKPFSPKVLVKRVEALLRISAENTDRLSFNSIVINCESYEVSEKGKPIALTLREFEILRTLMSTPSKVFTREQLLNHAWGYDYFGDERIVDVHIKNLRKKFSIEIIDTVKGVGYKMTKNEGNC